MKRGRPRRGIEKKPVTLNLDPTKYDQALKICNREQIPISNLVDLLLKEYTDNKEIQQKMHKMFHDVVCKQPLTQ